MSMPPTYDVAVGAAQSGWACMVFCYPLDAEQQRELSIARLPVASARSQVVCWRGAFRIFQEWFYSNALRTWRLNWSRISRRPSSLEDREWFDWLRYDDAVSYVQISPQEAETAMRAWSNAEIEAWFMVAQGDIATCNPAPEDLSG